MGRKGETSGVEINTASFWFSSCCCCPASHMTPQHCTVFALISHRCLVIHDYTTFRHITRVALVTIHFFLSLFFRGLSDQPRSLLGAVRPARPGPGGETRHDPPFSLSARLLLPDLRGTPPPTLGKLRAGRGKHEGAAGRLGNILSTGTTDILKRALYVLSVRCRIFSQKEMCQEYSKKKKKKMPHI